MAFFQQLTEKDFTAFNTANPTAGIADKAKVFINSVTGRMFGVNFIQQLSPLVAAPKFPQTFNFAGIFNKWSALGAGLFAYGKISPLGPHRGKAGTLGKALLTGGILGGFFDNPDTEGSSSQLVAMPAPMTQTSNLVPMNSINPKLVSTLR